MKYFRNTGTTSRGFHGKQGDDNTSQHRQNIRRLLEKHVEMTCTSQHRHNVTRPPWTHGHDTHNPIYKSNITAFKICTYICAYIKQTHWDDKPNITSYFHGLYMHALADETDALRWQCVLLNTNTTSKYAPSECDVAHRLMNCCV